jgi:hypothetical protein
MDVMPVSAVLYMINFANCYQNGPPRKVENNFLISTLGKLLVFLVNYAYYATLFNYEKLGNGCFGSFGTHYRYFNYFLWEK